MQHFHNLPSALSAQHAVATAVLQALNAMKADDQRRQAESKGWLKRIRGVFGAVAFAIGYAFMEIPRGLALAEAVVPWPQVERHSKVSDWYRFRTRAEPGVNSGPMDDLTDWELVKHIWRALPYLVIGRAIVLHESALWALTSLPKVIAEELAGRGPRYEWRPDAR